MSRSTPRKGGRVLRELATVLFLLAGIILLWCQVQPNCIHVLGLPGNGTPLYTICLDDMSIRCKILHGFVGEGGGEAYWAVPVCMTSFIGVGHFSFEQESSNSKDNAGVVSCETSAELGEKQEDEKGSTEPVPSTAPWSSLPGDLLELIVQEISFIDALHLRACMQRLEQLGPDTHSWHRVTTALDHWGKDRGQPRHLRPHDRKEVRPGNLHQLRGPGAAGPPLLAPRVGACNRGRVLRLPSESTQRTTRANSHQWTTTSSVA